MGAGLKRATAATALTRLTDGQRSVLAATGDRWMDLDALTEAAGIGGASPRETTARIANRLVREFVLDKEGPRTSPRWRISEHAASMVTARTPPSR